MKSIAQKTLNHFMKMGTAAHVKAKNMKKANALARKHVELPNSLNQDQIDLIKRTIASGSTNDELQLFIAQCNRTQLDPFSRQIYAIKRWDSRQQRETMAIQISIDGSRLVAERTGKYRGQTPVQWCGDDGVWVDVWLRDVAPAAAKAGVMKEGFAEPLYAVARFKSYAQVKRDGSLTQFWQAMPEVMIAKVAEALALRKAFPQELSGLYTPEEMDQVDQHSNVRMPDPVDNPGGNTSMYSLDETLSGEAERMESQRQEIMHETTSVLSDEIHYAPIDFMDTIIHFGKNKGKKLSEMSSSQVDWYASNWTPRDGSNLEDISLRNALNAYEASKNTQT